MLDTGPILGLLDAGDPAHGASVRMVEEAGEDLVIPSLVLVEVDYWIHRRLADEAWQVLVEDVARGSYRLEPLTDDDLVRASELQARYADLRLGVVDASVVATCERLGETKVGTLDRRHFSVVRPRHCDQLRLLPD